jgi:penicillin-binding protein 1A
MTKEKNRIAKFIKYLWVGFVSFIVGMTVFLFLISLNVFGDLPDIKELENPKSNLASEIYSEDGELLGKYFLQNRVNVPHDQISDNVYNALVATEDERFRSHSGIDLRALVRAVVYMGKAGGASTITQQLAKNLFHDKPKSKIDRIMQKFKEWVISVRLEKRYTKDEIITMYLNTVEFSGHSYGIKAASKEFFNKKPSELNIQESAVLVGVLKAISKYNPKRKPDESIGRRNIVLGQMFKVNYLTKAERDSLQSLPIELDYVADDHNKGMATYFREHLKKELKKWSADYEERTGEKYNIYKDGLKIYTTINSTMQRYAEDAMEKHMRDLQKQFIKLLGDRAPWRDQHWHEIKSYPEREFKRSEAYRALKRRYGNNEDSIKYFMNLPHEMKVFDWNSPNYEKDTVMSSLDSVKYVRHFLHTGFIAIEPGTGQVKAWVGGIDHKYFQYDHVNKNATRQVGSTFKPFVYALAIDNNVSPCKTYPDVPFTWRIEGSDDWTAHNSDGSDGEDKTLYQGLANSMNTITAQVMYNLGENSPASVIEFIRKMGVTSEKMEPVPALCLGTADISVFEMASAFTTFVNKGFWVEPTYLTRIEDKNGNILEEFAPKKIEQVLSEEKAYAIFKMLEGVVNRGTGIRLRYRYKVEGTVAGKTGTTQNNADGWFMGLTKNLVTATWVGGEDQSIRFRSTAYGQGANMALPIFANFIKSVTADKTLGISLDPLDVPESIPAIVTDCEEYDQNNGTHEDPLGDLGF